MAFFISTGAAIPFRAKTAPDGALEALSASQGGRWAFLMEKHLIYIHFIFSSIYTLDKVKKLKKKPPSTLQIPSLRKRKRRLTSKTPINPHPATLNA